MSNIEKSISERFCDEALLISYASGKFTDHKSCDSGNMNFSNCQVTSVTQSKDSMVLSCEASPSVSQPLFCFVVHYLLQVKILCI